MHQSRLRVRICKTGTRYQKVNSKKTPFAFLQKEPIQMNGIVFRFENQTNKNEQPSDNKTDFETFFAKPPRSISECVQNHRSYLRLSCARNRRQTNTTKFDI